MTFTLDVSDDFVDVVDNHEAVTVRPPVDQNANAELLTNGRFDEGLSSWSPNGATWEERLALCDIGAEYLAQAVTTVASSVYLVSLDVYGVWSATAPSVKVGTSADGSQIETNTVAESGRLTFEFTASGTSTFLTLRNGDIRSRWGGVSCRLSGETDVTNALRRAVTNREAMASGGKYRSGDVRWHVPQDELTTPPALGGLVIDGDGTEWTILAVDQQTFDGRWRIWTRRLSVADVTLGEVTIQKAILGHSPNGAEQTTWQDWAQAVPCRIQPQGAAQAVFADRRHLVERATVYLPAKPPIDHRFRIVGADERTYKVQGYATPDSIDGMFAIETEVNPWALN